MGVSTYVRFEVETFVSVVKKETDGPHGRNHSAMGFGTAFAAAMALFSLGGHWLDVKFDREPWFTLGGVGLGFIYGGYELWKLIVIANAEDQQQKDEADDIRRDG